MKRLAAAALLLMLLASCDFHGQMDQKFGDQHFKTVIALIELHHLRYGSYPETLEDLTHTGEWDQIAINAVRYKRLEDGYELDIAQGWVGEPKLAYPADFWTNLGIRKTNVGRKP